VRKEEGRDHGGGDEGGGDPEAFRTPRDFCNRFSGLAVAGYADGGRLLPVAVGTLSQSAACPTSQFSARCRSAALAATAEYLSASRS
jgi:hypothetical protein